VDELLKIFEENNWDDTKYDIVKGENTYINLVKDKLKENVSKFFNKKLNQNTKDLKAYLKEIELRMTYLNNIDKMIDYIEDSPSLKENEEISNIRKEKIEIVDDVFDGFQTLCKTLEKIEKSLSKKQKKTCLQIVSEIKNKKRKEEVKKVIDFHAKSDWEKDEFSNWIKNINN
jgi:hypoxanthine phosphoribosyltransferase